MGQNAVQGGRRIHHHLSMSEMSGIQGMNSRPWCTVWITGASSGLGRETAILLANQGCRVYASARRKELLQSLSEEMEGITPLPCDVTDTSAMKAAVDSILQREGHLDLVLLNAAGYQPGPTADITADNVSHLIDSNLRGVVNGVLPSLSAMKGQAWGQIAIVGSIAGYTGLPNAGFYGATKAALINYAESLRPNFREQTSKFNWSAPVSSKPR